MWSPGAAEVAPSAALSTVYCGFQAEQSFSKALCVFATFAENLFMCRSSLDMHHFQGILVNDLI